MEPADYELVAEQVESERLHDAGAAGASSAAKVFARTAAYDTAIAAHLAQALGGAGPGATVPAAL